MRGDFRSECEGVHPFSESGSWDVGAHPSATGSARLQLLSQRDGRRGTTQGAARTSVARGTGQRSVLLGAAVLV